MSTCIPSGRQLEICSALDGAKTCHVGICLRLSLWSRWGAITNPSSAPCSPGRIDGLRIWKSADYSVAFFSAVRSDGIGGGSGRDASDLHRTETIVAHGGALDFSGLGNNVLEVHEGKSWKVGGDRDGRRLGILNRFGVRIKLGGWRNW